MREKIHHLDNQVAQGEGNQVAQGEGNHKGLPLHTVNMLVP